MWALIVLIKPHCQAAAIGKGPGSTGEPAVNLLQEVDAGCCKHTPAYSASCLLAEAESLQPSVAGPGGAAAVLFSKKDGWSGQSATDMWATMYHTKCHTYLSDNACINIQA
jgi:hypothetical protein